MKKEQSTKAKDVPKQDPEVDVAKAAKKLKKKEEREKLMAEFEREKEHAKELKKQLDEEKKSMQEAKKLLKEEENHRQDLTREVTHYKDLSSQLSL